MSPESRNPESAESAPESADTGGGPEPPQAANWVHWQYKPVYPSDVINIALAHEQTHNATIGGTGGWPASIKPGDLDGDSVPDAWEDAVPGMDPGEVDSFVVGGVHYFPNIYSGSSPASRDNEFFSWMGGAYMGGDVGSFTGAAPPYGGGVKPVSVNREHDWAVDGFNWCKGEN